jgi:hypothetical protein
MMMDNQKEIIRIDAVNIYDKETIIQNCTVQILENTVTGEVSVGWWRNEEEDK